VSHRRDECYRFVTPVRRAHHSHARAANGCRNCAGVAQVNSTYSGYQRPRRPDRHKRSTRTYPFGGVGGWICRPFVANAPAYVVAAYYSTPNARPRCRRPATGRLDRDGPPSGCSCGARASDVGSDASGGGAGWHLPRIYLPDAEWGAGAGGRMGGLGVRERQQLKHVRHRRGDESGPRPRAVSAQYG